MAKKMTESAAPRYRAGKGDRMTVSTCLPERVRVVHGPNQDDFSGLIGVTVGSVRLSSATPSTSRTTQQRSSTGARSASATSSGRGTFLSSSSAGAQGGRPDEGRLSRPGVPDPHRSRQADTGEEGGRACLGRDRLAPAPPWASERDQVEVGGNRRSAMHFPPVVAGLHRGHQPVSVVFFATRRHAPNPSPA